MLVFFIAIDFLGNRCLISSLSLIFQVKIYWSLLLQHSISIIKALEIRHESSAEICRKLSINILHKKTMNEKIIQPMETPGILLSFSTKKRKF
jgi:hypothetical protein